MRHAYNGLNNSGKNFAAFASQEIHFTPLTRAMHHVTTGK
jgi:hypothetical protein